MNENDYDSLYNVLADSDIMRHYPYIFDEKRVRNWILCNKERYEAFGLGLWAVVLKQNGNMIGDCGLTMQSIDGVINPEICYHIAMRYQRCGYAKEAGKAVRDWIFENTPFNSVYSYMTADNLPSYSTAKALGMTHEKDYNDAEGEKSVYRITRERWERIKVSH